MGMRQIYLLSMDADSAAADEIERLLRERGYMVRRAAEQYAFPPAWPQEVTLALWSQAAFMSPKQLFFTNRAIDAWTEGRLVFARLDHALLPRGLSDIEAVDLSFAPARMSTVWKVIEAAQEIDRAMEARRREAGAEDPVADDEAHEVGAPPQAAPKRRAKARRVFSAGSGAIIGLVAAGAFASLGFLAMPHAPTLLVGIASILWGFVAGAVGGYVAGGDTRASARAAPAPRAARDPLEEAAGPLAPDAPVFVSYSRRNGAVVYPLVEEVEAAGHPVWIDRDEIKAGGNWAAAIVRAIRESDTFCLMCSAEAFQSDNVRREIYIADKYKRKLLPVRLDSAEMPEDFEYFLIDRQWLDLTGIDPAERAGRLKAALVW